MIAQIERDINKARENLSSGSVKIHRVIPKVNYGNAIKEIDMARVNLLYSAGVFDPQYERCVGPRMRKWFQQLKESKEQKDRQ